MQTENPYKGFEDAGQHLIMQALDAASSGVTIVDARDPKQPLIYVNAAFERITGYNREEVLGLNCRFLQGDDNLQMGVVHIRQALEDGESCQVVIRNYRKDGTMFWNELKISPIFSDDGELTHFIGVQDDVTQRVEAERARAESEHRYRIISEMTLDYAFCLRVEPDGTLKREWMTDAFEAVTGYTPEENEAKGGWRNLIHPDDLEYARQMLTLLLDTGMIPDLNYRIITKSGEEKHIQSRYIVEKHPSTGKVRRIYGIAQDVTQQKDIMRRLQSSEARFRSVVHSSPDVIYTLDDEMHYTGLYGQWVRDHLPDGQQTLVGQPQADYMSDESAAKHKKANTVALQGYQYTFEWKLDLDDQSYDFQTTVSPLRSSKNEIIGIVGIGRDITHLRELEQQRLDSEKEKLALAKERELVEMKQQFISMVSHEFRTPLSIITSAVDLVSRYYERMDKVEIVNKVKNVLPQIKQMTDMLEDVLLINRTNSGIVSFESEAVNLKKMLQVLIDEVKIADDYHHHFKLSMHHVPAVVKVDPQLLRHILINLLNNAAKYSEAGTFVHLYVDHDEDQLTFTVQDMGVGIPEEEIDNLFEPFQRGSNVKSHPGSGLGLAIVKHLVNLHDGQVNLRSVEGHGTTATVTLSLS